MSFQITLKPNRRVAARFIGDVRRAIVKAYVAKQKESGVTQTAIARELGVHRSVINRELRGKKDLTLGRVAELAWALGLKPSFDLLPVEASPGVNHANPQTMKQGNPFVVGTLVAPTASSAVPMKYYNVGSSSNLVVEAA